MKRGWIDLVLDQETLRHLITDIIKENPNDLSDWGKEIGVNQMTLRDFLKGGKISFKTACAIEKFIRHKKDNE